MIQVTNNPEEQFIVMKLDGYSSTSTAVELRVTFTCQYSGYVKIFTSVPTVTNGRYTKFPITTVSDTDFIEGLYLVKVDNGSTVYANNALAFVRDQVPFSESEYVDYDDNDGSAYNVYVK
tara:strand:+ start:1551 stop:1910 length:360 start_codon:yes stop_codon:yes gene_type:complete